MSYSFKVTVEGGQPRAEVVYGPVPDGVWTVSGHEDQNNQTVGIARQVAGAATGLQASASVPVRQPAT